MNTLRHRVAPTVLIFVSLLAAPLAAIAAPTIFAPTVTPLANLESVSLTTTVAEVTPVGVVPSIGNTVARNPALAVTPRILVNNVTTAGNFVS